ncbi:uncharacterized protein LOC121237124 [Juglans microcarpa x Juglans regia]|uniref:uncharacterized protein LOC121237124 n=1 Tax=Juglans microcarpa x Juglans regia TaxID=2249226 RepID=UPI001B7F2468|nr:uncharacterized protein LOC121237124 [Juglans microcarpa x Juglans regia]
MHRQSLGSPVTKIHGHGAAKDDTLIVEDPKRRGGDDDEYKALKPRRLSLSSPPLPRPEKFVHVIPLLTLLCFLILYLCSHSPSQSDLAQFNGFKRPAKHIDQPTEINDVERYIELQKGAVWVRSLRNLQELGKRPPKSRSHRKLADL